MLFTIAHKHSTRYVSVRHVSFPESVSLTISQFVSHHLRPHSSVCQSITAFVCQSASPLVCYCLSVYFLSQAFLVELRGYAATRLHGLCVISSFISVTSSLTVCLCLCLSVCQSLSLSLSLSPCAKVPLHSYTYNSGSRLKAKWKELLLLLQLLPLKFNHIVYRVSNLSSVRSSPKSLR